MNFWQRYILLYVLGLFPLLAEAGEIDSLEALRTAEGFFETRMRSSRGGTSAAPELALRQRSRAAYVFSAGEESFVVVAADDRLPAILGYGTSSRGGLPPALQGLLRGYERALSAFPSPRRQQAEAACEPVVPLLSFVRHQDIPFNRYCPYYRYEDGTLSWKPCQVGCVATALEEVMSYYRRVVVLRDTLHGWSTDHYDVPDALPGETVDTRLIRDRYDEGTYTEEEVDAVARLSFYCGLACKMNWGLAESGARIATLVEPMQRVFGYGYVHHVDSYEYTPEEWRQMLEGEIRQGRPVLYAGYLMQMGGHAFVLDGLDADGLFHVNWGYGGDYDGYFLLDALNAFEPSWDTTEEGLANGFFCNHEALLLHPDAIGSDLPEPIVRSGREVAVDSVTLEQAPEAGKFTSLLLHLRNTSDRPLTTPFELFTNSPSDTALFRQADYIALAGCSLQPGESRSCRVHVQFSEVGDRIFGISPDDEEILLRFPLHVAAATASSPVFGEPLLTFPEEDRLFVSLPVDNRQSAGRMGHSVVYEVVEGDYAAGKNGTRHVRHLYLPAGTAATDTVSFRGLQPGAAYTLLVRDSWPIVSQTRFVVPAVSAISRPTAANPEAARWFTPDGRAVVRPSQSGVYIRKGGQKPGKVFVK